MKLSIACDHAAWEQKNALAEHLRSLGHAITDHGVNGPESVDYPEYAKRACQDVQQGKSEAAILLCGSGIGMAIAANKMKGIRAALLSEPYSARMSRVHNNANVICFGARVIGWEIIRECAEAYLAAEFGGGKHATRVDKIMALEGC